MFVRTLRRKNRPNTLVQIVRSYRDAQGRPRQELVCSMGAAPEGRALEELIRLAELRKAELLAAGRGTLFPPDLLAEQAMAARRRKRTRKVSVADIRCLEEDSRLTLGYHEVFGELWGDLGLDEVWTRRHQVSARLFRQAVLFRLAEPGRSKRAQALAPAGDYGVETPLEKVYRMMDQLDERRIGALRSRVAGYAGRLLGGRAEVVFMDATTLSFAAEGADELRKKGYSKDGKPHRVQVVLALVQSAEGLPLGYRLFPGNTADVKTLMPLVTELGAEYALGRVVVVADAGMASRENLSALTAAGFDWVMAVGLRKLGEGDLAVLAGAEGWETGAEPEGSGEFPRLLDHTVLSGALRGRRLVVRHSPKKARKDRRDRAEAVRRAQQRLAAGLTGKGRVGRFLRVHRGAVEFDQEAVRRDALFDGLHGVLTSLPDPPAAIRAHYAELWRIEHGFRVLKGTLRARPVFHWTEPRVRAHIAICFIAFALLRILRWKFRRHHPEKPLPSEERILRELGRVQASLVHDTAADQWFLLPSRSSDTQRRIYRTLGLSLPRRATPTDQPKPKPTSSPRS